MIISASRRTDIPAFFGEWFVNRLEEGQVLVRNPMNYKQVTKIPLTPTNVDCVVFWTKNPENFMRYLQRIDDLGYKYYFLFTLNSYDSSIEQNVSKKNVIIDTFKKLSDTIGPEKVVWRYDPIVLNGPYSKEYHFKWFDYLANDLSGYTNRCIISFVDFYKKIEKKLAELNATPASENIITEFGEKFGSISRANGLSLYTCSQEFDLIDYGIDHSKCVDDEIISNILGLPISAVKDSAQRDECGCIESRDIGAYDTCPHECLYCYANTSHTKVKTNYSKYDPSSPLLCDFLRGDERITECKKSKSLKLMKKRQGELF